MAVREAVDHRALEAEFLHTARKLVSGRRRIGGRQRGERRVAGRLRLDDGGEPVVDAARKFDRPVGDLLQRGRRVRKHLDVDAGRIHVFEPRLPGVGQARQHMRRRGRIAAGEQRDQLGVGIMLFDRDDGNVRFLEQGASPFCWKDFYGTASMPASSLVTAAISSAFIV